MTTPYIMTGIIKKKGKHSMQGYKDREFTVDRDGIMRYGVVGEPKKWNKKIKLTDIKAVEPQMTDPRHSFTIEKKNGRVLFFVAQNDEEKWKWINGFRAALRLINKPDSSAVHSQNIVEEEEAVYLPLLKLSKYSQTGIWRWRFFKICNGVVSYYNDPCFGELLGSFPTESITRVTFEKNKYGQSLVLQIEVKNPDKRSYFFSQPDEKCLAEFNKLCIPKTHGFFNFF